MQSSGHTVVTNSLQLGFWNCLQSYGRFLTNVFFGITREKKCSKSKQANVCKRDIVAGHRGAAAWGGCISMRVMHWLSSFPGKEQAVHLTVLASPALLFCMHRLQPLITSCSYYIVCIFKKKPGWVRLKERDDVSGRVVVFFPALHR